MLQGYLHCLISHTEQGNNTREKKRVFTIINLKRMSGTAHKFQISFSGGGYLQLNVSFCQLH
jgi:hypothetical protein